jgi:signal-transduction protein with cAMP-binding, CBS, and nucleotidyltransferase domain
MTSVLVTVGPAHTLRDAAKRMTEKNVGAAVIMDSELPGPAIITERDLLHSNGRGEDMDKELVRDHLSAELIHANSDWPLQRAAVEMTKGGFRHVIVMDGPEVVGILSMRDIVRCWVGEGASAEQAE